MEDDARHQDQREQTASRPDRPRARPDRPRARRAFALRLLGSIEPFSRPSKLASRSGTGAKPCTKSSRCWTSVPLYGERVAIAQPLGIVRGKRATASLRAACPTRANSVARSASPDRSRSRTRGRAGAVAPGSAPCRRGSAASSRAARGAGRADERPRGSPDLGASCRNGGAGARLRATRSPATQGSRRRVCSSTSSMLSSASAGSTYPTRSCSTWSNKISAAGVLGRV